MGEYSKAPSYGVGRALALPQTSKRGLREIVITLDVGGDGHLPGLKTEVSGWVDASGRVVDVTVSMPRWRIENGRRVMLPATVRSLLTARDHLSRALVAAAVRKIEQRSA